MLKRFLPGLRWYEDYRPGDLKADLISGLTVAFILIPQGMAYAAVAGLPPELGLYACIFPPLIYALLGTSNKISVGPVALDSILILSGLSLLAEPGTAHYRELAIALTLCVGLIQVAFGYIKLGFVANFLSYPVILGYTAGAAVVIMCSQLEGLLGVTVDAESAPEVVYQALINMSQWHMFTAALGLGGIALMIAAKRVAPKWPTPLILLSAGMLASGLWSFADFEVDVIDRIPSGIPTPRLPQLGTGALIEVLPVAFTVAIMGYIGGISICKALESPRDRVALNPNQELIAIGFANLVGALFRAFPVSASFSRSAAFRASGAVTQLSAVVSAAVLLIALLALAPVFSDYPLPKTLLAS
ncbi:MAG: SulP family inorganic anion transporter, partial [Pseudomonadota bacterium]